MCTPPPKNLSSGTKYWNFHLKFDTSIPLVYLPVCMCTGFPSYIGYISLSSTFPSLVYYGSTKAVAYSDQHVMRYAIGQFVCRILSPPPLSRLLSEFSDFFHLRNVKYRLLSNLYLAEFSKEEKWRWTIIWNEFKLNDSIGDKKTTSKPIHQILLMAENEFTPKMCKIKFLIKKLTIRVALYMLISIDHLFCWSVVNEWWKCWAKGYITNVWWEPSTDTHW